MEFRPSKIGLRLILVVLLAMIAAVAFGQNPVSIPSINVDIGKAGSQYDVSSSLQILALLTILSVAPAILILTTAFSRIVIIFSFLRQALGTPTIPPNQVVIGLSLFLTFFVMGPTYSEISEKSLKPYLAKQIKFDEALTKAEKPIRAFMVKNTYSKDLRMFLDMRGETNVTRESVPLTSLIPAFIVSELKTAFIIGFYIFIPFLIIDLIVSSGLMSMGMMMLPPTVVSLPVKLLVFVLADGWATLVSAIMAGYR